MYQQLASSQLIGQQRIQLIYRAILVRSATPTELDDIAAHTKQRADTEDRSGFLQKSRQAGIQANPTTSPDSRSPLDAKELSAAEQDIVWALLNSPEFLFNQ